MDTALSEINGFLANTVPFDQLPQDILDEVIKLINICYVTKGNDLPPKGHEPGQLYIVRKGALGYFCSNGELLGKYGEGDVCTVFCQSSDDTQFKVKTEEDCLLYCMPFEVLSAKLIEHPKVADFFMHSAESLLSNEMTQVNADAVLANSLINTEITQFYNEPVATIDVNKSITDTAVMMADLNYSCLVVTDSDEPVGIVTDKDVCRRCVAKGLATDQSVSNIMSTSLITLDIHANAFEAVMLMTAKRIHHLPVTRDGKVIGMVSMTDLVNYEGQNAVSITAMIHKAKSIDELTELGKLLPSLQERMSKMGATAELVGKSISAITAAFSTKLIQMFEQQNGSAPVTFAWLGAGSEARKEQLAYSDQDNALIISNEMQDEHKTWFEQLATFVCDGLAKCGYVYCPGDVMATNEKWRQTQKVWQSYFNNWVDTPKPKALLHSSIFFDMETVYGDASLLEDIRQNILKKTAQNSLFIAHLSANALGFRPPLGFFRDFVLIGSGEHKDTLDIKHFGITPIVDLARIYALTEGIKATNTIERLKQAAGTSALTKSSSASLIAAYQFLTTLRLRHHARKTKAGEKPDNYIYPKSLSRLEREHLKAAFKVIKTLQDVRQKTL